MIFTGLKENRIQKQFEKTLIETSSKMVSSNTIQHILVISDGVFYSPSELKTHFSKAFLLLEENITVLIHVKKLPKEANKSIYFSKSAFRWNGKVAAASLQKEIANKYDLLIHFSAQNNTKENLVVALSKAVFKVGFANRDERMYDLMIAAKPNDLDIFTTELIKYLQILNKIPCNNSQELVSH